MLFTILLLKIDLRNMTATSLRKFIYLSIAAAVLTIVIKFIAYLLTNSVGLLSDALESCVNLVAAVVALIMLTWLKSLPMKNMHTVIPRLNISPVPLRAD
jgi:Co/Zn/Cd efflux system component